MAAKTFFLKDVGVSGFGSLSETDPGASTMGTGWVVAKVASGNFSALLYGTERASGTFSTTDYLVTTHPNPGSGDSWRSENTINGSFANANWTFTFAVRAVTQAGTQRGRIKLRVWKSVNANGSSATELTSATQTGGIIAGISTTADNTTAVTWSPGGVVTLTNEYLFVQCEWEITTAGNNNGADIDFRASASTVVTSDFTLGPVTGNLTTTEAADTLSAAVDVIVGAALTSTEAADTLSGAVDVIVTGNLSSTEAADTLVGAGTVTDPPRVANLNSTEDADTLSAGAGVLVAAVLNTIEDGDILVATGTVSSGVTGDLNSVEDADTLAATGSVFSGVVTGDLNSTEDGDTILASVSINPAPPINPPTPSPPITTPDKHVPGIEWQFLDRQKEPRGWW